MQSLVESSPKIENLKEPERNILYRQFYAILVCIGKCANEEALRTAMEAYREKVCFKNETHHFHWGFGGSHMWVKQRGNDDRVVFVKLLNQHI